MKDKLPIVVALAALLMGMLPAHASETVRCDVLTIEASNSAGGIDKALMSYAEIFKQKPFSDFDTFQLVHRQTLEMPLNEPVSLTLPESLGGSLKLDRLIGSKLELTLTLARQGHSPIQIQGKASPGTPFFAAGFKNPKGVWIFGVACIRDDIVDH